MQLSTLPAQIFFRDWDEKVAKLHSIGHAYMQQLKELGKNEMDL